MHQNYRLHRVRKVELWCVPIILLIFIPFTLLSNGQETSITIELQPSLVESKQNFTVSVYDSNIQIGTPYLVNVTILFAGQYYQITPLHENGELTLRAPEVLVNRSYLIEAYTLDKKANATLSVIPVQDISVTDLVIIPDAYIINAYERFTVLITNKNGQPIADVLVSIQQSRSSNASGTTDINGKIILIAPNKETIIISAEKQGYDLSTKTVNIVVQQDVINSFLSHPYTPIIGSFGVLLVVIIYVSYSNMHKMKFFKFPQKKIKLKFKKNPINKIHYHEPPIDIIRNETSYLNPHKKYVEEIQIFTPPSKKIANSHEQQKKKSKPSNQWFRPPKQQKKEMKQLLHQETKNKWVNAPDDIHEKIDDMIAEKEKKKQKSIV